MAENLNYECHGSKCYKNNPANADIYGRLYDFETAKKACPIGWHLPTEKEWEELIRYVEDTLDSKCSYKSRTAGKHLKAKSGWNDHNGKSGNGLDTYGFSALPGRFGNFDGKFFNIGNFSSWWQSGCYFDRDYDLSLSCDNDGAFDGNCDKGSLYCYVRCLKD